MIKRMLCVAVASFASLLLSLPASAEKLGEVDTSFNLLGANHSLDISVYDDPLVDGVSCYVSRAVTGGITGAFGLAEDTSDASIACRQVGPIKFKEPVPQKAEVFNQRLSLLFKRLRVVRLVDAKRNTLVYQTYSDKLIDGSPKGSITAVPVDRALPIPVKR